MSMIPLSRKSAFTPNPSRCRITAGLRDSAVGEIFVSHDRVPLYASPEGLGQAFAFDIQKEAYDATAMRKTIDGLYNTARGAGSTTTWVLSNHDVSVSAFLVNLEVVCLTRPGCSSCYSIWSTKGDRVRHGDQQTGPFDQ